MKVRRKKKGARSLLKLGLEDATSSEIPSGETALPPRLD
jgi:hypothetical protein